MTAPTTTPEITRYRDAVRAALADLSAEDRDDLMEDVESHLTEVAAENDGSLARLGSPADYAAELRTSAGLPAPSAPVRTSFWARLSAALADSAVGRGIERAVRGPQGESLRKFLPELRPGWWVLRGYLVAVAIYGIFGFAQYGVVPQPGNSVLLGLVLVLLAVWASVRLGRYTQAHRALRPWIIAGNGALLLFFLFVGINSSLSYRYDSTGGPQQTGLVGVSNVYVFDSEGRLLTGVQLFDQDGNPLQVYEEIYDVNGMPVSVRRYVDANGTEVYNVYPRETNPFGGPRPNFVAPRLAPTAGPSVPPSPGASPSTAPSGGAAVPLATPTPR